MDAFTLSRRRALAGALLLVVALVVAVRHLSRGDVSAEPMRVQAVTRAESAPRPQLVVHVVGAVRRPGLYRLDEGERVADAVARAGGATRRADLAGLNLAAPLADGLQIVVPARGAAGVGAGGSAARPGPVHLNAATVEQLDELPGIGPVTAQKIVEYRERHGAFTSVDDLDAVPGIGPARLEELRELVQP